MKKIITIIIIVAFSYASKINLISDYNFTNQKYNYVDYLSFYTNFPYCKLTGKQKELIYRVSRINKINVLVVLTKLQNETDLFINNGKNHKYKWRENRAMGYGLIHSWRENERKYKFYKYGGFEIQVFLAAQLLRKSFDKWKSGKTIKLLCIDQTIIPDNASTFSIYVYNPFYGTHSKYGYESTGNKLFEIYYAIISKKWKKHIN